MKKKVLIITTGFDGTGGGKMGAITENFLSKYYDTITLVFFEDTGIFKVKGKKISKGALFNFSFPGRGYIEIMPHIYNTIKHIKIEKPDIVICIGTYCNLLGLIAKKFLNFKLLLTQHEYISSQKSTISKFNMYNIAFLIIKKLIGNTKIVCVSNDVKIDTIKQYCIKEEQAHTIYNGLNFSEIKKLGEEKINIQPKYIINIGRLDIGKNQELLIKAYSNSKIKEKYKLLLLGDGYKKEYLKNLCKNLGIDNLVIFVGFDKNPYKYLKKASLFCFTSLTEALPTVLIESLILDIPIITVPVTGTMEILNGGKLGVITKDWNPWNLKTALDTFEESSYKKKNKNREKYVNKNFSILSMEKNYLKIIANL